jgi:hypothetical protein
MERLANSRLVRGLVFLVLMLSMQSSTMANVAVQDFATHIEEARTVLIGTVKVGLQGQIILVVETSLKGSGKPNEELIIDANSKLAWRIVPGGGPMLPANHADFVRQIQQTDWYQKRALLVGSIKDGKWVSYCYDWSVWTSGASTRDETLKDLSFEELVEVLKSKLGKSAATHQVKTVNQATNAEKPDISPTSLPQVVEPTELKKAPEAKLMPSPPSEEPSASTPGSLAPTSVQQPNLTPPLKPAVQTEPSKSPPWPWLMGAIFLLAAVGGILLILRRK